MCGVYTVQGQWLNNVYSGAGKLSQVSGASYDGLWINGCPEYTAVKLVIAALDETASVHVAAGESFSISVECRTDSDQLAPGTNNAVSVCSR